MRTIPQVTKKKLNFRPDVRPYCRRRVRPYYRPRFRLHFYLWPYCRPYVYWPYCRPYFRSYFSRERPAKGSCCVRLPPGPSCASRPLPSSCRRAAGGLPSYRNLSLHMGCLLDKNRRRQPWLQTRHLLCPQPRKLQHLTSQYHQHHRGGAEGAPAVSSIPLRCQMLQLSWPRTQQ